MNKDFFILFDKYAPILKGRCILHFSTGKDAIACLHILTTRCEIKPKLCYWNLNPFLLEMHRKPLEYFSDKYKTDYVVVPHYDMVADIARKIHKRPPSYKEWLLKLYYEQGEKPQVFGVKESDGLIAKMMINKGARENLHRYYPLAIWKDDHVFRFLESEGVPIGQSYKNGFRDINEFVDAESLEYLKENYKQDYDRLISIEPWRLSLAQE